VIVIKNVGAAVVGCSVGASVEDEDGVDVGVAVGGGGVLEQLLESCEE
jgi:hypothetical protein